MLLTVIAFVQDALIAPTVSIVKIVSLGCVRNGRKWDWFKL